jgi:hypothetical protein
MQHELFQQELAVHPPANASGPRLWVRRVVVWREPGGEKIQDVKLRPGLNIVWTPDDKGIGHGGGKTLFCRLVRYCLGEDRFAPDDQRSLIAGKFPDGFIGAEVVLDGVSWAIIRPLGIRRRHLAVPDGNLEELAVADSPSTGLEPLLDAIEKAFFPAELAALIPSHRQDRRGWLIALAWLTRDQECRFDNVLAWRSAASDSDSPARGLNETEKLDALRVFLQAITIEEQRKRQEIAGLEESRKAIALEHDHRQWQINQTRETLLPALGLNADIFTDGTLAPDRLRKAAQTRLEETSQRSPELDPTRIETARRDYEAARADLVAIEKQIGILNSDIPNIRRILAKIEGEYPGLSYAQQEARSYPCPICDVPIDRALATQCNLSHKLPDLEACRQRLKNNRDELAEEGERLKAAQHQLDLARSQSGDAQEKVGSLKEALARLEMARDQQSAARYSAREISTSVTSFEELSERQREAERRLNHLNLTIEHEREIVTAHLSNQTPVFVRLSQKFDPIIRSLVGPEASGKIALTGKGLVLTVQMGGTRSTSAIDSLKVIAFDAAALCLCIEGNANLPAFWVHDSPREADLGIDIYHRMFLFVKSLENIGNKPCFQYIVTTTTAPPDEVNKNPFRTLTLRGTPAEERLLKTNL